MPLSNSDAGDLVKEFREIRDEDQGRLDLYREYLRGVQAHPQDLSGLPAEARAFLDASRINLVELAVEIPTQSLYVDGYRPNLPDSSDDAFNEAPGWRVWQANRMDSRQTAVHRGAFSYGVAYVMILPGDPVPLVRGHSPRNLTVIYGEDPDWPLYALHTEPNGDYQTLTLYDHEATYRFTTEGGLEHVETNEYDLDEGVELLHCPVVRFPNVEDLDDDIISEIERLIPIQNQMDLTSFDLMVTQHYQAFIQRYAIGWEAKSEAERLKAAASRLWTFDDPDVKVGQFQQAQLDGYLKSREDTAQLGAVISQTPPHHLLGQMINLSAEALAAAESGHRRKITMKETTFGERWEQGLGLAEMFMGIESDVSAQVRWKDTEARSLAQTVDALGKMAEMLHIPPDALWERVPGVTQQDLSRWRRLADEADTLTQLAEALVGQSGSIPQPGSEPSEPAPNI